MAIESRREVINGHVMYVTDDNHLHREDGPAVEYPDGTRMWYTNGRLHRTDGPALISSNGDHTWYTNGRLHRTDGPAHEGESVGALWYINGKQYSFMEWANKLHKAPEEITSLSLQYNKIDLD